jgi:hypothetical protein
MFLEPGEVANSGVKAPGADAGDYGEFRERKNQHQYPPILRYSMSQGGIRVLNPAENTDRNILRVYTDFRS